MAPLLGKVMARFTIGMGEVSKVLLSPMLVLTKLS
jgi:hypothetical protein